MLRALASALVLLAALPAGAEKPRASLGAFAGPRAAEMRASVKKVLARTVELVDPAPGVPRIDGSVARCGGRWTLWIGVRRGEAAPAEEELYDLREARLYQDLGAEIAAHVSAVAKSETAPPLQLGRPRAFLCQFTGPWARETRASVRKALSARIDLGGGEGAPVIEGSVMMRLERWTLWLSVRDRDGRMRGEQLYDLADARLQRTMPEELTQLVIGAGGLAPEPPLPPPPPAPPPPPRPAAAAQALAAPTAPPAQRGCACQLGRAAPASGPALLLVTLAAAARRRRRAS